MITHKNHKSCSANDNIVDVIAGSHDELFLYDEEEVVFF